MWKLKEKSKSEHRSPCLQLEGTSITQNSSPRLLMWPGAAPFARPAAEMLSVCWGCGAGDDGGSLELRLLLSSGLPVLECSHAREAAAATGCRSRASCWA